MKLSEKIKINWKPPEVMAREKPVGFNFIDTEKRKSIQDQVNAELNEMSTLITEWYVER